ncbi:MAG: DUF4388 domain-containing protein [Planctomycetota bacterium]|nr:DUF4388 domain-containing protein [Planctomycetota bacterium]
MTIKGTLETFNLRELLQMLAFNQKVGTLVLETERGPRTVYVDQGRAAFLSSDILVSQTLLRLLRRRRVADPERLQRAYEIAERSNRFLGDILLEMGLLDEEQRSIYLENATCERLFNATLTAINRFEFVDSQALDPEGREAAPIEPSLPVEGLLLELTRKVDHWQAIEQVIPSVNEIFEGTGTTVDLADTEEELDLEAAELVVPAIDGYKSLEQIAESSDVDLFTVVQIAAALFEGGGIRPVPTEDLLVRAEDLFSQGDPAHALPLLRRGIERGDAPAEARLRVADALEACGERDEAAAELDTYAALSDGENPPSVFQALNRALNLRGGDLPTSARLCDYYLRHRAWLSEYRHDAGEALKTLVHFAQAEGRPQDAAPRLAGFLDAGEAPFEELKTLAELYAADGNNAEAAAAMFKRAEQLLGDDRVPQAREALRRSLDYDPSRADARRRLMSLDGQARKHRQRRRIMLVVVMFSLLAVGAAGAWWSYNREAADAVRKAQKLAESAVAAAESKAKGLIDEFETFLARVETSRAVEADLGDEVERLRDAVKEAIAEPQPRLGAYAAELEAYAASGHEQTHRTILRGLEQRLRNQTSRATSTLDTLGRRAKSSLTRGEAAYKSGEIKTALKELLRARNLAFEDPPVRERAKLLLDHVDAYVRNFDVYAAKAQTARDKGDIAGAFQASVAVALKMLDSDLTRELRFPVEVVSDPAGAQVFVGGKDTGQHTPCTIDYSPFEKDTTLLVRMPGRTARSKALPSFTDMSEKPDEIRAWTPKIELTLPVGVRYRVAPKDLRFRALWVGGDVPVVLSADGYKMYGIEPTKGVLQPPTRVRGTNPMRTSGIFEDGTEWRITGQRTIWVQPPGGEPWEAQAQGLLERTPAVVGSTLTFVDELGMLYGFHLMSGEERWRKDLGSSPGQSPYESKLGILVATETGAAFRVDPDSGSMRELAAAARGTALALPFGDGALFLGGGEGGCRQVDANGKVTVLGDARPMAQRDPWFGASGIVWIEEAGVVFMGAAADAKPVRLEALGTDVLFVTGADDTVYVAAATGEIRAANVSKPDSTLFRLPLGGRIHSAPVALGNALFILVDGTLVSVER